MRPDEWMSSYSPDGLWKPAPPGFYKTGDYEPAQWDDWYAKSSKHGTREFAAHQDFMYAAKPRLRSRMDEWYEGIKQNERLLAEAAAEAGQPAPKPLRATLGPLFVPVMAATARSILGMPPEPNEPPEVQAGVRLVKGHFLDWMKNTALGGEEQPDVSVTPEQYEQFGWDQATNKLSPAGAAALGKLKDYRLFQAFQTDPTHRPAAMQAGSSMMAALGMPGDLLGRVFSGPSNEGKYDFDSGAIQQLVTAHSPSPYNSLKWTMGWHRQGQRVPADQVREYTGPIDRMIGLPIWNTADPQYSGLTGEGADTGMFGGDTPYGSYVSYLSAILNSTLRDAYSSKNISPEDTAAYAGESMRTGRHTPIVPEQMRGYGEDGRPRWADLQDSIERMQSTDRALTSMYLPKAWRGINFLIHQLKNPGIEPQDEDPYRSGGSGGYVPTTYGAAAANVVPNAFVDTLTDPSVAAGAVLAEPVAIGGLMRKGKYLQAAGKAAKGAAAATIGEIPGEAGFAQAIQAPSAGFYNFFAAPDPLIPLSDDKGNLADAESKEYLPALQRYEDQVEKEFGEMRRIATMRKTGPLGSGVIGSRPDRIKPITGSLLSP